ncbi:MAG: S8 family serine peptidase [Gammaproteobacteria bacterium]|nr:S8 family serine peptidase [Gammaproteobacteria bacterium]
MPFYRLILFLLFICNSTALIAESSVASAILIRWIDQTDPTSIVYLPDGAQLDQSLVIHSGDTLITKVQSQSADSLTKLLKSIRALPGVIYAEPDYPVRMNQIPDDSLLDDQWYLSTVNAFNAWDLGTDCSDVIIVTVDTGIDLNHPELVNNLWQNPGEIAENSFDDDGNGIIDDVHGYNPFKNNGNPDDDNGHGTHVAGVIAAAGNNADGIAGLCWSAQVMAIKFLDHFGGGTVSDAVRGIQYAIDNKPLNTPMIINNSWVIGQYSQALEDVLKLAEDEGIFVTVAAGNTGADNDEIVVLPTYFRKQFDNIISVANVDQQDNLYVGSKGSSNFGLNSVDISAPGTDIYSTFKGDAYKALTGTSMATPVVSGAAALALKQRPEISAEELKAALLASVREVEALKGKLVVPGVLDIQQLIENIYDTPQIIYRYQGEITDRILSGEGIRVSGFGLENTLSITLDNQQLDFEFIDTEELVVYLPSDAKDGLIQTDVSNSLFLKVSIEPPVDIDLQMSQSGLPLLSWNNRSNAEFVEIERASGDSAYQVLTSVSSPQSVFQDTDGGTLTACYRIRSGFNYIDPYSKEAKTKLSDYSTSTSIDATSEAVHWSTQTIGSVVKGELFAEQLYARSLGGGFNISTAQPMPVGFDLSSTGYLTGFPDEPGDYQFDILLTTDNGCPEQKTINLTVTEQSEFRYLKSQFDGLYNLKTDRGVLTRLQSRDLFSWEEIPEINHYEVIDLSIELSPVVDENEGLILLTINNDSFESEEDFNLFVMDRFDEWVELTVADGVQKTAVGFNWVIEDNELFDHEVDQNKVHLKVAISVKEKALAQSTDDNRCFIASVIYKNEIDRQKLKAFRALRDDFLSRTLLGRMAIDVYYRVSPEIAWWLLHRPNFSKIVKFYMNFLYFISSILGYLWFLMAGFILYQVIGFLNKNKVVQSLKN